MSPTGSKFFDLNIGEVLEHWAVEHAVREVIANSLDEALLTGTAAPSIAPEGPGRWVIRDFGRGIRPEHFILDENPEKQLRHSEVIGTFGVGLKDALAVFHRHGIEVEILSRFGRFTPRDVSKHGFEDIYTLHLECEEGDGSFRGTEVRLANISDQSVNAAKGLFRRFVADLVLEETTYGAILHKRDRGPARIYLKGVLVAEEESFLFSYDITSLTDGMKKKLSRERQNVGRTLYTPRVKAMLLEATSEVVLETLVSGLRAKDPPDEVGWVDVAVRAIQELNRSSNTVFVTYDQAMSDVDGVRSAEADGFNVVVLPGRFLEKAEGVRDLLTYHLESVATYEFEYVDESDLTPDERRVWEQRDALLRAVGLDPLLVPQIMVSETLRTMPGDSTLGVWTSGRVIVKRTVLRSLQELAGVMLHEIAHWKSGASDCTREFEFMLATLLGRGAASAVCAGEGVEQQPPGQRFQAPDPAPPGPTSQSKDRELPTPRERTRGKPKAGRTRGSGIGLWRPPADSKPTGDERGITLEMIAERVGVSTQDLIGEAYQRHGTLVARNRILSEEEQRHLERVAVEIRDTR